MSGIVNQPAFADLPRPSRRPPVATGSIATSSLADGAVTAAKLANNVGILDTKAAASGTTLDWSSLPAGIQRITIMFQEVSLSGTDNILVQIGDGDGLETASYISTASTGTTFVNATDGFIMRVASASSAISGHMVLTLLDVDSDIWVESHAVKILTNAGSIGGGSKNLDSDLNQVRVLMTGSDSFDGGGAVAILYE